MELHNQMVDSNNYIPHPKSDIAFQNMPQVNSGNSSKNPLVDSVLRNEQSYSSHIPEENTDSKNYTEYNSSPVNPANRMP